MGVHFNFKGRFTNQMSLMASSIHCAGTGQPSWDPDDDKPEPKPKDPRSKAEKLSDLTNPVALRELWVKELNTHLSAAAALKSQLKGLGHAEQAIQLDKTTKDVEKLHQRWLDSALSPQMLLEQSKAPVLTKLGSRFASFCELH